MKLVFILFSFLFLYSCSPKKHVSEKSIKKGVSFIDQEDYKGAVNHFQTLLIEDVDDLSRSVIYRNISISFQCMGELDSAKYYAKKSYTAAPDDSFEYYLNKADYYLLINHVTESLQSLEEAKLIDPNRQEIYNRYCSIYSGEYGEIFFDPELAEKNAVLACKIKSGRIVKEQLGSIYFQNEKYKQSARIFNELIGKYPQNKKYTFYMGQALYFDGNENRGLYLMKQAAERDDSCKIMFQEIFENI